MIWRILLWLSIIWIAPLVCLLLRNETKFKKNLAVGVTIPYTGRKDEEVQKRLDRFKREVTWICVILVLAAILCVL